MSWDYMNMHGYYGGFMWIWFLLFILIIVVLLAPLFKKNQSDQQTQSEPQESALEILEKRFARGEINEEEFKKMKDVLINS
ncbi:SHOCT domain-containing protein [Thiomicrorhabdus sp. 6S3-12]|uniref:SHOCT domain-containing protein n=1 Tax=Thiomicrorhabdus sp. 6S3-12 TaxID=2819681 RepID=UPI001AAD43F1|nr:SHOCT domain-containing protein [Thiomicrorhabdus sp. 6S3-12]MBO1924213.1 SHOCT domain-containing protein [Thiomicrorhabdus sp. 6S3-12]